MAILWIILIVAAYFIFRERNPFRDVEFKNTEAIQQLKKRYANGEIEEETYLRMKKNLES